MDVYWYIYKLYIIQEGAIANIAFVLKTGEFCSPPYNQIIKGTTLNDAIDIINRDLV